MSELTRRDVLRGAGALAGATALTSSATVLAAPTATADTAGAATVGEGTNISASVSPDGRHVAFDLVTAIWTVPITGGAARRLTTDDTDATQPSWSPDGRSLVFQAYRDGNYHVYTVHPDGSGPRQLTSGPYDHREPRFSPDGRTVAFSSDLGGSYGVHTLDVATGAVTARTDTAADEAMPAWSRDGRRLAYTVDSTAIDVLDLSTGAVVRAVTAPAGTTLFGPSFSPDGVLAYVRIAGATAELVVGERVVSAPGEDVFAFAASWLSATELLHTADGVLKRRGLDGSVSVVPFAAAVPVLPRPRYHRAVRDLDSTREQRVLGIASPVASPDGTRVAFRALNALWLLRIGDARPTRLVAVGFFNSDPDF
ncbi:TolB family protein, partial [Actinophytocola sp.]|uniref:TolB family protein n=1 Tax=Actinophytocola sp. TaxID=1872138 RepID=UPI00389A63BC